MAIRPCSGFVSGPAGQRASTTYFYSVPCWATPSKARAGQARAGPARHVPLVRYTGAPALPLSAVAALGRLEPLPVRLLISHLAPTKRVFSIFLSHRAERKLCIATRHCHEPRLIILPPLHRTKALTGEQNGRAHAPPCLTTTSLSLKPIELV
jgi:hypothetical protein